MNDRETRFEDEVELIDYLRVMWKWKWLIVLGTLFCAVIAFIYSFTRPVVKKYEVSALIEVDPGAKLDPLVKIKSMIDYGLFDQRVLDDLSNLQEIPKTGRLSFEVAILKDLNMLDIAYRTANPDVGEAVLNALIEQLKQEYASQPDRRLDEISMRIALVETRKEQARLIEVAIDQTKKALQEALSNSDHLSAERKAALLNPDNGVNHATLFMDAAAISQVVDYPLTLRERLTILVSEKSRNSERIMSEIMKLKDLVSGVASLEPEEDASVWDYEDFILKLKSKIDSFPEGEDQFTGIIVRQPPTASSLPVKNKTNLIVILAGAVGFFGMLFLIFFLEYIQKHRGD